MSKKILVIGDKRLDTTFNRSWDRIHKFEEEEKISFLKKLTAQEGFKIFSGLYQMIYKIKSRDNIFSLNSEKLRILSKIHFTFNKLKI